MIGLTVNGSIKNRDDFLKRIKRRRVGVSDSVMALLERIVFSDNSDQRLKFVIISATELGFPGGASTEKIYTAGINRGWKLCPHDAVLKLFLAYSCNVDHLFVAMNQLRDPVDNSEIIFRISKNGDTYQLNVSAGDPKSSHHSKSCWLFLEKAA